MAEIEVEDAERVADESDRASIIEEATTQESIRKALSKIEKAPNDFDGMHCVVCGEPIPEGRLKTGAFRDIYCQQRYEARIKNFRRD